MSGNDAKVTGVVAALPAEARCILEGNSRARGSESSLLVRVSGIGVERAARTAEQLLEAGAEALLSFGVGGALDPALRCGDIVLASEVLSDRGSDTDLSRHAVTLERIATGAEWQRELAARLHGLGRIHRGAVLTSRDLIDSVQRKQQLFDESGALAVDMESAAVGRTAQRHGVPFMALRVIADTAHDALPAVLHGAFGSRQAFAHDPAFWWSLLSAPRSWPGLARLGHRYRCACAVLKLCAGAGLARTLRPEEALSP